MNRNGKWHRCTSTNTKSSVHFSDAYDNHQDIVIDDEKEEAEKKVQRDGMFRRTFQYAMQARAIKKAVGRAFGPHCRL